MKEYQCSECGEWITGYRQYKNHTCGKQLSLNDNIDGVEFLGDIQTPEFETAKTKQTKLGENPFRR